MLDIMKQVDPRTALAVYVATVVAAVAGILVLASWLREPGRDGFGVYESGAAPGRADARAAGGALFPDRRLLHDLRCRGGAAVRLGGRCEPKSGATGLIAATVFIGVLLAAWPICGWTARWKPGRTPRRTRAAADDLRTDHAPATSSRPATTWRWASCSRGLTIWSPGRARTVSGRSTSACRAATSKWRRR